MTRGQRIKYKREELNISQTDFAKKVNISKQTLYKYENNIVTNIPYDKIVEIADALGVTPGYIMGWEDSETSKAAYETLLKSYIEKEKAKELYDLFSSLSPEKQAAFEAYLKFLQSES